MSSSSSQSVAGQRRRAYQCLRCLHIDDKVFIEARYRLQTHFMRKRMSLDVVPLYCKWCLIVADKREDMVRHVSSYTRHRAVAKEKGLTEDHGYLVENRSAYVITEWDVATLSAAESLVHWSAASTKRGDFYQECTGSDVHGTSPSEDNSKNGWVGRARPGRTRGGKHDPICGTTLAADPRHGTMLNSSKPSTGTSERVDIMKDMSTRHECRALGTTSYSSSSSSSCRTEENHLEVMKAIRGVRNAVQVMNDIAIQQLQNTVNIAQTCSHLVGVVEEMKASSLPIPKFTIPPPQFPSMMQSQHQKQQQLLQQP